MNRFMFGYCATLISALLWPSLLTYSLACIALLLAFIMLKWSKLLAGSLLALAWMSLFCHQLLLLTPDNTSKRPSVRGEIISLVYRNGDWINLDIRLLSDYPINFPSKYLRLRWQTEQKVAIGEVWQFTLAPKSITSVLNQGGFNQQAFLLSKHIIGKGNVQSARRLSESKGVRAHLITQLQQAVTGKDNGDLIRALMLGDKQGITKEHWQGLRQTGTGHLVTISGLHLSVLALWVMGLSGYLLARQRPSIGLSNRQFSALLALCCCMLFAYLAGLGLPTQRALIMLFMVIVLGLLKRYASAFERLLWALFVVLLLDPVSILSAGLWLSFGALALILYMTQRIPSVPKNMSLSGHIRQRISALWQIQWRLSIMLGLLQALLFGGFAPYGVLYNLVFVPWFSLVVIPLTFVSMMCWALAERLGLSLSLPLSLLDWAIAPLTSSFNLLPSLPLHWLPAASVLLAGMLFLWAAFAVWRYGAHRWRWLSLPLILPLCLYWLVPPRLIENKHWQLHLLDVGQGLSLVIEKQNRAFIYDTGAAFGDHFSYAERVIVPFLQYKGISDVDYLVLSHGDNDHAGGAQFLQTQFPKLSLITDLPYRGAIDCRPKQIAWQGLNVQILGPAQPLAGNNGSCVMRIGDGTHHVLLPGDIELEGEQALLGISLLDSDILIAPHHGSNTSSSQAFISAVQPKVVLYAAGFNNRYGFPKPHVVSRYAGAQAKQYSVSDNGQLTISLDESGIRVRGYRRDLAPFWYNQRFEFGEFANPE
ncbi:DNA internalization-related competence protein ComEC/Rec2 [Shewanella marisflavi]|uniref:DNA internalization-related competence protein ComEC/Rec2 n=1 Tax=Shewanella marisflavi TaxID=260364 RepID=A0AAC9U0R3_9GAMM|nr:DNA internalization-related competence protein ComEC/Rec2 [Shewanella marisflavi]ASJ97099.1 DNA internalization-related competence protein ComEC/Rec2 [Shewanella marisflavi]